MLELHNNGKVGCLQLAAGPLQLVYNKIKKSGVCCWADCPATNPSQNVDNGALAVYTFMFGTEGER